MTQASGSTTITGSNGTKVIVGGQGVQIGGSNAPMLRARQQDLTRQLEQLQSAHTSMVDRLQSTAAGTPPHDILSTQLVQLEQRIAILNQMIASNEQQIDAAPTAIVQVPPDFPSGPPIPKQVWPLSAVFILVVFLPMSIAMARRVWTKGAPAAPAQLSGEMAERLSRMEQAIESTALEVERIGEGQRYLTRVLGERTAIESTKSSAADLLRRTPT